MPIIKCKVCQSKFYSKPFWIKQGKGKYCSRQCSNIGVRTGKEVQCDTCGKLVYKQKKALRHSKSKKYFCSKRCQTRWRNSFFTGKKHANWKHGEYSYKSVLIRHNVEAVCRLCKTKDKRILAVHHVDHNRKNNQLGNLVWLCHNCHHLVHWYSEANERLMVSMV